MTIRTINDKIRENELHIRELFHILEHSLDPIEDSVCINKMIRDRVDIFNELLQEREVLFFRLKHGEIPECPRCGRKLKPVLFMRMEPDGYYCSHCKAGFDDDLKRTSTAY